MKPYYEFLYRLRADGVATRFALEHRGGGRLAEQIEECLQLGYIEQCGISAVGEPQYRITALGKQYLDENDTKEE